MGEQIEVHTRETIDCNQNDEEEEEFTDDHEIVLRQLRTATSAEADWEGNPVLLYQVTVTGSINEQGIHGDADLLFIWSTPSGAEVRVIDVKRTKEQKVYHQIQAAAYAAVLRQLINGSDSLSIDQITISGGVITQETAVTPVTRDSLPAFDIDPRIADLHRLLDSESSLLTALRSERGEVEFQLDSKCGTCPYNEGCVTESFEYGDIRLLGLTVSQQRTLREYGVQTIADVAALCLTPDEKEWTPVSYKRGSFQTDTYKALARIPGLGQLFPQLVYRAEAMLDALQTEPDGVSDRPQNWLPGSGRCSLPDDEPSNAAPGDYEWQDGSMVRVYLNVQYDHLRDRLIQLNARVTATASETPPQRISVVSDAAPDEAVAADKQEQLMLERFCPKLFKAVRTVSDGLSFEKTSQCDPLLHFYMYTEGEYDALVEAFDRHPDSAESRAFRSAVEGTGQSSESMVSTLRSEIESHIVLETPSPGLLHAYKELYPTVDGAYSKSRDQKSWSYSPPSSEDSYDLRRVFSRRLFDIGAAAVYPDVPVSDLVKEAKRRLNNNPKEESDSGIGIEIDPETAEWFDGINTRMRHDASIPLAYLWAAVGRIDDDWESKESIDESALAEFELNRYRFRDTDHNSEIGPADVQTLGRHLCDILEHVERSLSYKDPFFSKEPYPVEELDADTFDPPSLADGVKEYLHEEYRANREEKHHLYRQFPLQRVLAGESIPVYVTEVDKQNRNTLRVTGRLRYEHNLLFDDGGEQVKRACRQKGAQGTSSGSWMVANPYDPSMVGAEVTRPYAIERGVNATIQQLDIDNDQIQFTLRNFWSDGGDFGQPHADWTTNPDYAADDHKVHIKSGEWLILDPQTDDITAERAQQALDHADTNALHQRLEQVRHGKIHQPETPLFELDNPSVDDGRPDGVDAVATWLRQDVGEETYPSPKQQKFITEDRQQFVALQGPPGTGKTAATMAPALLARLYAGACNGVSVNGLVTAPSNTAIDELLSDVADLLNEAAEAGPLASTDLDIELVRIGEEPADPIDGVTYANYNNEDHAQRIRRITQRLRSEGTVTLGKGSGSENASSSGEFTVTGEEQSGLSSFTASSQDGEMDTEAEKATDQPLTLVFATTTRSWRFLKEVAPGSNPDERTRAEQQLWHLLAVDEASMLELPNFLLAGSGFHEYGQVLVGGDHRQLPPVQKRDWEEVRRRDIRSTAAHLSTLDYLRLLRGDEVLEPERQSQVMCKRDPEAVEIELIQLETTYRFGEWTAEFVQQTVYEQDEIKYSSGRDEIEPVLSVLEDLNDPLVPLFDEDTTVALLTYTGKNQFQQSNPIEGALTEALVLAIDSAFKVGVVTPHNAQRGRVQSKLQKHGYTVAGDGSSAEEKEGEAIQVDTVNRFQGGERDLMMVNATVSDPNYIAAEDKFLLTENRINVSFTRHRDMLIVFAPESLIGYLPEDPDLYEQATLWKSLSIALGEAPIVDEEPDWQGQLGYVLTAAGIESVPEVVRRELQSTITIYTNS
ncbi:bifunctional RecB family nuclease/DEAD/DEAH box helicase [Halovivax cerinus]|uniref:AAA domain-containing protein n=1 Tax=Halovivax cerinus TaxID=1487865 RepID=A0ABD5NQC8_9EURY|nr:bifunctional RecB family nuclease/DEAD/DEAH box helicase [Halovivax cerinus]